MFYVLANLPTYVLLWVRQRMLYNRPMLFMINTWFVRAISCLSLLLMIAGGTGNLVVFLLTISYHRLPNLGCVQRLGSSAAAYYQIQVSQLCSHVLLFGLFCHPLRLHWQQMKESRRASGICNSETREKIRSLARNALVTLAVCSASDFVALLCVTRLLPVATTPKELTGTVFDVGLFVNIVSVVVMEDIREMTVGVCMRRGGGGRSSSSVKREGSAKFVAGAEVVSKKLETEVEESEANRAVAEC